MKTKAHSQKGSLVALGKRRADSLALQGRHKLSLFHSLSSASPRRLAQRRRGRFATCMCGTGPSAMQAPIFIFQAAALKTGNHENESQVSPFPVPQS